MNHEKIYADIQQVASTDESATVRREKNVLALLQGGIKSGDDALATMSGQMVNAGAAMYILQWASSKALSLAYCVLCEQVLDAIDNGGMNLQEAMTQQLRRVSNDLMGNRYNGGSTSDFSNAVDAVKREAAYRFHTTFIHYFNE